MKDFNEFEKLVRLALADAVRTENRYSVFLDEGKMKVSGSRSKGNGRKLGTAVPKTVFGNRVAEWHSR